MVFYHLGSPDTEGANTAAYGDIAWEARYPLAEWDDSVQIEHISCPIVKGHSRAGDRIGDLAIVLGSPRIGDFVWTSLSDCLITQRVRSLLEVEEVTGYELRPVTVTGITRSRGADMSDLPELWELVVTGHGGDALPESGVRMLYRHEACGLVRYSSFTNGLPVDTKQWDGSDIFTVNGYPKFILVSERVKDLIAAHQLTNCMIVESTKLQWGDVIRPEDIDWEGEEREAFNGADH
jgi:hypothetical protein